MRDPDVKGSNTNASAWRSPSSESGEPSSVSTLAGWLIHYPGVHAVWDWWMWSLVTLAEVEGLPPAKLHYSEARYELVCFALDPEHYPPNVDSPGPHRFLRPPDLVKQFHVDTDEAAVAMVTESIEAMISGGAAPPDSDFRRWWGDTIDASAALVRTTTQ